ncbi:MAG: hypothetical protein KF869_06590 [Phycisphaeraceae bacterium]|nr:hypothetical protein [Phycisphaeraceae bacterium]
MVRMCDVMTLACATVMAAGTVATAQNKAAAPAEAAVQSPAPGSFRQIAGNNMTGFVTRSGLGGCSCPVGANAWWNGDWDPSDGDGQASHEGGGAPGGAVAADDFFLCDGYVHTLRSISVQVLNNSTFGLTRARLEIWSDCNGCPGDLLYVLNKHGVEQKDTNVNGTGFNLYTYTFELGNTLHTGGPFNNQVQDGSCPGETVSGCTVDPDCFRYIALKGGTYWISVVGRTDGQGTDLTFWATANSNYTSPNSSIKGSVAKKRNGVPPMNWMGPWEYVDPWMSVEDCCVGCTDLAFRVCYDSCKILKDNGSDIGLISNGNPGVNEEGARSERSGLVRNSRAADDFVVPPCADFDVCYVEGCIYTNCPEFTAFFEIYRNDCKLPYYTLGTSQIAWGRYVETKRVCLGYEVAIDGVSGLKAYRVEFHDITGIRLNSGQQYWISIGVQDTFSFIERAYFCRNRYCDNSCPIMFNPGAVIDPAANYVTGGVPTWRSTKDFPTRWGSGGTDFSFLIAGETVAPATGPNAEPLCVADSNNDGTVDVSDIFHFLAAWFAGCP